MNRTSGSICPFCQTAIRPTQQARVCGQCGIPHHADCWVENGRRDTFDCDKAAVPNFPFDAGRYASSRAMVWSSSGCIDLTVDSLDTVCPQCGRMLDFNTMGCTYYRRNTAPPFTGHHGYTHQKQYKSPKTARLPNLLLPGAVYFYLGRVGKGFMVLMMSVLAGFYTDGTGTIMIICFVYAMMDCYEAAECTSLGLPD